MERRLVMNVRETSAGGTAVPSCCFFLPNDNLNARDRVRTAVLPFLHSEIQAPVVVSKLRDRDIA